MSRRVIYLIFVDDVILCYRIAVSGKLSALQLSALVNMHYSHMIRFDDEEEAR